MLHQFNDTADIAFVIQEDVLIMQVLVLDGKSVPGFSHSLQSRERSVDLLQCLFLWLHQE